MQADIEYTQDGMFTRFLAVSEHGVVAWNQLATVTDGTGAVLNIQAKQFINDFRKAGYIVRKAKKVTKTDIENLYAELDDLFE